MATHLTCPMCDKIIEHDGLNLDHMLAKCRHCHALMNFDLDGSHDADEDEIGDQGGDAPRPLPHPTGTPSAWDGAPLPCPTCAAVIPSEDMNLARRMATCKQCHAIVPFPEEYGTHWDNDDVLGPVAVRPPIPPPVGIRLEDAGEHLKFVWRWALTRLIIVPILFWMACTYGLYWVFTSDATFAVKVQNTIYYQVPMVGLYALLTYNILCMLVNHTVITVDKEWLTVRPGPLPWAGFKSVPVAELKQLYVDVALPTERNQRMKSGGYHLHGITVDAAGHRHEIKVVSGLYEQNQALYLEQEIERFLGLDDRRVAGEVAR